MKALVTKKLPAAEMDLIHAWHWDVDIVEVLDITPREVVDIPKTDAWVVSSRNSFEAVKKFLGEAPPQIFCVGTWMKEALTSAGARSGIASFENMKALASHVAGREVGSVLYFCGDEHRPELESALAGRTVVWKAITHRSKMICPQVNSDVDAVFVFSPRGAESLLEKNQFDARTVFACIGATTAQYVSSRGVRNTFISSRADTDVLLHEFWEFMNSKY